MAKHQPSIRQDTSRQASVGVAIMAKDAERTLPKLLDSIRPFVKQICVGVDERTTDKTARVAKAHGADEVFPLHVSDWHECGIHDRQLVQHFGNARQETFRHLDPNLDFWCWLDADDVLVGGEKLQATLAALPADHIGMWLPYEYGAITRADGVRQVNTLFHRERFLRTHYQGKQVNWVWEGRVHETVKPDGVAAAWTLNDEIVVVHQDNAHPNGDSAPRNLILLEIDNEDKPLNPRTVCYLGNTYFALGNWQQAINWFELLCSGISENDYEIWQAYCYMSLAYESLGDLDSANKAAYAAIDVIPIHGEPYFRIAAIAEAAGEAQKAIEWNLMGRTKTPAPFFAFKNPLDYTFNQRYVQGKAFYELGRLDEAEFEWKQAAKVFIDDRLASVLGMVQQAKADAAMAESFVALAPSMNGQAIEVYEHLPESVKTFGRTRDVVMPGLLKGRLGDRRIVFWCGRSAEPWGPPSLNTTGIGGSETAVIEIARRFAADGWCVDVFNEAERFEGIHDGVGYWDLKRFNQDDKADVFVSWRKPDAWRMAPEGARKILWCHDLNYGPDPALDMRKWGLVLGVSAWHSEMLMRYYSLIPDGLFMGSVSGTVNYVPNGIDLTRFAEKPEKVPYRCVYASSPDRGLDVLLHFWPQILKAEPEAELHIAYGWDTIDRMISLGRTQLAPFKADMLALIERTPRVVWRGRLPQDELAKLYGESVCWTYPTHFLEVSCISAMEAMAGGAIPVVNAAGALPETVGNAGFLVPGPVGNRGFQDTYPRAVLGVLLEKNVREAYQRQGRLRATGFTWEQSYDRWKQVLGLTERAKEPEREAVAV